MRPVFRNLPIVARLSLAQSSVLLLLIGVAAYLTSTHLQRMIDTQSPSELHQANRLVVAMHEACERSERADIERTARSTQTIAGMIEGVRSGAREAVRRMGDGAHQLEQGSQLAEANHSASPGTATSAGAAAALRRIPAGAIESPVPHRPPPT